jgi:hypothetical protein
MLLAKQPSNNVIGYRLSYNIAYNPLAMHVSADVKKQNIPACIIKKI